MDIEIIDIKQILVMLIKVLFSVESQNKILFIWPMMILLIVKTILSKERFLINLIRMDLVKMFIRIVKSTTNRKKLLLKI